MPLVQVHMLEGREPAVKRRLIEEITRVMVETAGARPSNVTVLLSDYAPDDWGTNGHPISADDAADS